MKLHNIATWEKYFPTKQIEHVYYTTDMLVRKVTGYYSNQAHADERHGYECHQAKTCPMGWMWPMLQHQQQ